MELPQLSYDECFESGNKWAQCLRNAKLDAGTH